MGSYKAQEKLKVLEETMGDREIPITMNSVVRGCRWASGGHGLRSLQGETGPQNFFAQRL
jgi:hypothetical protein